MAGVDGCQQGPGALVEGFGDLADGLVEAGGNAVELAGKRGGQLLLTGGGGFSQYRVPLHGVGL